MSEYPRINFNLNLLCFGFTTEANNFIKNNLTNIPSDTSYKLENNNVEIHLKKWFGKTTGHIYREVFDLFNYRDKLVLASYLEEEFNNSFKSIFRWRNYSGILPINNDSNIISEPEKGYFMIKNF